MGGLVMVGISRPEQVCVRFGRGCWLCLWYELWLVLAACWSLTFWFWALSRALLWRVERVVVASVASELLSCFYLPGAFGLRIMIACCARFF